MWRGRMVQVQGMGVIFQLFVDLFGEEGGDDNAASSSRADKYTMVTPNALINGPLIVRE